MTDEIIHRCVLCGFESEGEKEMIQHFEAEHKEEYDEAGLTAYGDMEEWN